MPLFVGVHNLEQAEKDQEEQLNAAAAGGGDQEADDEDDEDDEDGYDSGSGFPSALTPPDSPPFQVRFLKTVKVKLKGRSLRPVKGLSKKTPQKPLKGP